ncbi:hypothetical protein EUX98_g5930 [Antrodiella citrinella]|uniref:Uncharacterized protein n=1 Tax=Antrodiella citrinella TaxID=2447956 RepID=A0A4S4MSU8_9APHY|nr:hypothetical protein EUX98_g5930 [Antrodiella citrinella]
METYCSRQCARDDTMRALMGEENVYRQKVQARQDTQQKNAGRRYAEKIMPRLFVQADHPLPPTPAGNKFPPIPPPKSSAPRNQSTKENHPPPRAAPPVPRPIISGPFALQPQGIMRLPGASTSRLQLPVMGHSPYKGPRPAAKKTAQNVLHHMRLPPGTSRKDDRAIRRSASESHVKKATANVVHLQTSELKDPPLTYYLQPPHAFKEIRPTHLAPTRPLGPPLSYTHALPSPYTPVTPERRQIRHSKSFSPYKPFFPANVPEDVNQDSMGFRISGDVWWVVKGLREIGDVDYKAAFLARQTQRW